MFTVYATTPETMGPGEIGGHAARAHPENSASTCVK